MMENSNMPEQVRKAIEYLNERGLTPDTPIDTSGLDEVIASRDADLIDDFDDDSDDFSLDTDGLDDLDDDISFDDEEDDSSNTLDLSDDVDTDDLNSMF